MTVFQALTLSTVAAIVGVVIAWLATAARGRAALSVLESRIAVRDAELAFERKAAADRGQLLEIADARLRDAFQALSAEALRQNNDSFLQLATTSFERLHDVATSDLDARQRAMHESIAPIREALDKVDGKLQQVELARIGSYESLIEQVRSMAETQRELSGRTRNLVDALRSPTVRGR